MTTNLVSTTPIEWTLSKLLLSNDWLKSEKENLEYQKKIIFEMKFYFFSFWFIALEKKGEFRCIFGYLIVWLTVVGTFRLFICTKCHNICDNFSWSDTSSLNFH